MLKKEFQNRKSLNLTLSEPECKRFLSVAEAIGGFLAMDLHRGPVVVESVSGA